MKISEVMTQKWVLEHVIGLQLCPFAKLPFTQNRIRFEEIPDQSAEQQLIMFWKAVEHLLNMQPDALSNTLLIFPHSLHTFDDYLDFFYLAEELLKLQKVDDQIQLASFHPSYQFEGYEMDDPGNYINRSPFPVIHLLRVDEVSKAIENHPGTLHVHPANRKKLEELGIENLKSALEAYQKKSV